MPNAATRLKQASAQCWAMVPPAERSVNHASLPPVAVAVAVSPGTHTGIPPVPLRAARLASGSSSHSSTARSRRSSATCVSLPRSATLISPVSSETTTVSASVCSVIPIAARWRVPRFRSAAEQVAREGKDATRRDNALVAEDDGHVVQRGVRVEDPGEQLGRDLGRRPECRCRSRPGARSRVRGRRDHRDVRPTSVPAARTIESITSSYRGRLSQPCSPARPRRSSARRISGWKTTAAPTSRAVNEFAHEEVDRQSGRRAVRARRRRGSSSERAAQLRHRRVPLTIRRVEKITSCDEQDFDRAGKARIRRGFRGCVQIGHGGSAGANRGAPLDDIDTPPVPVPNGRSRPHLVRRRQGGTRPPRPGPRPDSRPGRRRSSARSRSPRR